MRLVASIPALLLSVWAAAQTSETAPADLFRTVAPQATIIVTKHNSGADVVQITMLDPNYPAETLRAQIADLGKRLDVEPRGVQVFTFNADTSGTTQGFLRASFAVNGLIDDTRDRLRLQPIVQAMAGVPAPFTLRGLGVIFANRQASRATLAAFSSPAIQLQGTVQASPPTLEYRVKLLEQAPDRIVIPDTAEPIEPVKPSEGKAKGVDGLTIGLIAAAVLAAGALVYSLALRGRSARA